MKEKQIDKQAVEEMAKDIFEPKIAIDGIDLAFASVHGADKKDTHFMRIAEHLVVNKGYRKQSEWISVDERLPDTTLKRLIICDQDIGSGEVVKFIKNLLKNDY